MEHSMLAAVAWDPTIRGYLFPGIMFVILCGSAFMILGTNLGVRSGFLISVGGLMGWMALMGFAWMIYGIGLKGEAPHWVVTEVVTGPLVQAENADVQAIPKGWRELEEGDPVRGEAQAAADAVLIEESVFSRPSEYLPLGGYQRGGERYFPGHLFEVDERPPEGCGVKDIAGCVPRGWARIKSVFAFRHAPNHSVIQVQAAKEVEIDINAKPIPPKPDPGAPVVSVVMERDLGSLRLPPTMVFVASLMLFLLICGVLHRKDTLLWAARETQDA